MSGDGITGEHSLQVELLTELEQVIERGLETFIDVGKALVVIQEQRLYRTMGFATFETYCQERWGWSRKRAYRLITAAEVVSTLVNEEQEVPLENTMNNRQMYTPVKIVEPAENVAHGRQFSSTNDPGSTVRPSIIPPPVERQARELGRIRDIPARRAVWNSLVKEHGDRVTHGHVHAAVDAHLGRDREVQERRQAQGKAVADFIQNTESWKQNTLAIECFQALSKSKEELTRFDTETVIPLFDDIERRIVEDMLSSLIGWLQAAQRELRGPLRLVGKD